MRAETLKTWMIKMIAILLAFLMVATGLIYLFTH